jgi:hypothetical protein
VQEVDPLLRRRVPEEDDEMPPVFDAAETSGGSDTNAMPAPTNGYGTPYSSVSRVVSGLLAAWA